MTSSDQFTTKCLTSLPESEDAQIKTLLREHNQAANPELWAKFETSEADPQNLHVVSYTLTGELIGGLLATTSLAWLKIDIMAVDEAYRGRGLGSQLLQAAEQEAIRRGCKYSFLDTMDYQAPQFYRQNGYTEAGSIADWDSHGHVKFYFTKALTG